MTSKGGYFDCFISQVSTSLCVWVCVLYMCVYVYICECMFMYVCACVCCSVGDNLGRQ